MTTEIRIRAFRATEDPETCLKFIEGHKKVLSIYGIENITTNTDDWMYNPSIFVIVVESMDRSKLYGGARVQAADGIHPLPIELATGEMDPKIYKVVKYYSQFGAAELSGLWNSKEVAGFGIGSVFPSRVALSIFDQIGTNVMFSLCSPATVRFKDWIGGNLMTKVGNNGTFYYPKLDLLATVLYSDDVIGLSHAHPREKVKILDLRENPVQIKYEKSPFKNVMVNVHYDLVVKSAIKGEFLIDVPEMKGKELSDVL
jgi:hypothetical protein